MTGPACGASVRESRREGASRWSPPSVRTLQLLEDPLDGDLHPIRPVVELVPHLVKGARLEAPLLEKALYEMRDELNNRPDWVKIPIEGILQQLEGPD